MDDASLCLALFRHVDHGGKYCPAPFDGEHPQIGKHIDLGAVCFQMMPHLTRFIGVGYALESAAHGVLFTSGANVEHRHVEKLLAAVAIVLYGRVIDLNEAESFSIEKPHGHRIAFKQQPKRFLFSLDVADVGQRDRKKVADRYHPDLEMAQLASGRIGDLEGFAHSRRQCSRQMLPGSQLLRPQIDFGESFPL